MWKTLIALYLASCCFSALAIDQLAQDIKGFLDKHQIPGMVTMVMHDGKLVHQSAIGFENLKQMKPIQEDAIFRLYSMTKPVVSVAIMQLVEQGKLDLEEDIRIYLPELAPFEHDGTNYVIKLRHLLNHTAGLGYFPGITNWIDFQYLILDPNSRNGSTDELIDDVSGIELKFPPGKQWMYSIASDLLGAIVEKTTNMTLQAYFSEHVFKPLNMHDTNFMVPAEDKDRLVDMYDFEDRELGFSEYGHKSEYLEPAGLQSGGSGLVSTAEDYMKFLSMLLNKGQVDEQQVLSAESVELMTRSHTAGLDQWFLPRLYPGAEFGFGFGVQVESTDYRAKGSYFWAGRGGTSFWVDPERKLAVVSMIQMEDGWKFVDDWLQKAVIKNLAL